MTPREQIDDWVAGMMDESAIRLLPIGGREVMRRYVMSVRAALGIIDRAFSWKCGCGCGHGMPFSMVKDLEAALWKAISGGGEVRVLVCGGRDFSDRPSAFATLDDLHAKFKFSSLIDGGARGADRIAHEWASGRGIPTRMFLAQWELHGKAAGPIRNQRMLEEGQPDMVIAFPGGRGTADMIARAKKACVPVVDLAISGEKA